MIGNCVANEEPTDILLKSLRNKIFSVPPLDNKSQGILQFLLRNQEIENKNIFLKKSVKDLWPSFEELTDLDKAIQVMYKHFKAKSKIGIIGDYDVDGTSATALLVIFFKKINVNHIYKIPNRFIDGYGITPDIVRNMKDQNVDLIITVDNGTSSYEAIEEAKKNNIEVIILDHHGLQNEIEVAAFVNPQRDGERLVDLCAASVTFIFIVEFNRFLKKKENICVNVFQYIDIVAVATICDVIQLSGLSRSLVAHGLEKLNSNPHIGLETIMSFKDRGNYDVNKVGFYIGPYINVAGRFGFGHKAVELLTAETKEEAKKIAIMLGMMNIERKNIENLILQECESKIEEQKKEEAIFVKNADWHEGVLGIVAGKIKNTQEKTACVVTLKNGKWKGSIRSIPEFLTNDFIKEGIERGIISSGGGHNMAGGICFPQEKEKIFVDFFHEFAKRTKKKKDPIFEINSVISLSGVTIRTIEKLNKIAPFGMGNPEPIFLFPNCKMKTFKFFPESNYSLIKVSGASSFESVSAILFNITKEIEIIFKPNMSFHLIATMGANINQKYAQLNIQDIILVE